MHQVRPTRTRRCGKGCWSPSGTGSRRSHQAHVARLKETKAPEVLTVNGRAEIVVQDAESDQRMLNRLHHLETVAAIREGIVSAERGELKPAEQVLTEMKAKYGLQG